MRKGSKMTAVQKKRLSISHLGQKSWNKGKKCPYSWGKNHPNWKGGKSLSNTGYIRLQVNGSCMLEHRFVMEKYLNRKLNKNEVVHHKNGIKTDNRIKNLELISNNSKHMRMHKWSFGGKETIICFNCNKEFTSFKSNQRTFCSRKCYAQKQKEFGYGKKSYSRR
jgi:hypothetical protein